MSGYFYSNQTTRLHQLVKVWDKQHAQVPHIFSIGFYLAAYTYVLHIFHNIEENKVKHP